MDRVLERSAVEASGKETWKELVREQLAQLELLYRTALIGLCLIDRNLRYIRINELLASINGKPVEDHIGRSIYEVIPEVASKVESIYRRVIETGEPMLNLEVRGSTPAKPKEERCWLVSYYPLKDDYGTVQAVSTVVQDITDLQYARLALRHSGERLQALVEGTRAVPWEANAKTWQFTYLGPQIVELLGYPIDQWFEKNFWADHIHPEDREFAVNYCMQSSASLKDYEFEYRMIASDRSIVWIHDIVNVEWVDGEPKTLRGFVINITDRKTAEERLRESEERFRIMSDTAPIMIWMSGPDKLCNYFNKGWLEFRGRKMEEELGNGWAEGVHPDDLERCLDTYISAFDAKEEFKMEYRLRHFDREYRWILDHGTPRFLPDGTFAGYIGSCTDISEHKQVQWELKERLRFETLLSNLSARFLKLSASEVDKEIDQFLKVIVEFLGVDRSTVVEFSDDKTKLYVTHSYAVPGIQPFPLITIENHFPWYTEELRHGEMLVYSRLPDDLPDEATAEKEYCLREGFKSNVTIPLIVCDSVLGAVAFGSFRSERNWPDELVQQLRLLGEVFANALSRKRAELGLQKAFSEINELKDQLQKENIYLRQEIKLEQIYKEIVGHSSAIKTVLSMVEQVAKTDSTVLMQGETGTGKELLARAVHNQSRRKGGRMVKVNCAAIPSTLIESELFGREKGAYTGALSRQIGRFEVANGSTIFLDEIGELSLELQAKLLRVLQEGQFERLGSPNTIKVDVRVIAASNRDLSKAVREGRFREDLYYRLNVFPIEVPPLRERREDIPALVWTFVKEFGEKIGKRIESIPRKSMEALQSYHWPGNVRELRNVIERAMILTNGSVLLVELPGTQDSGTYQTMTLEQMEKKHIIEVLEMTGWRIRGKNGAAEILGLRPTTLESKMSKLGIEKKK